MTRSLDGAEAPCGCNVFDPSCRHEAAELGQRVIAQAARDEWYGASGSEPNDRDLRRARRVIRRLERAGIVLARKGEAHE